jgi:hypothetical protein
VDPFAADFADVVPFMLILIPDCGAAATAWLSSPLPELLPPWRAENIRLVAAKRKTLILSTRRMNAVSQYVKAMILAAMSTFTITVGVERMNTMLRCALSLAITAVNSCFASLDSDVALASRVAWIL